MSIAHAHWQYFEGKWLLYVLLPCSSFCRRYFSSWTTQAELATTKIVTNVILLWLKKFSKGIQSQL
jgi:hypothetical protein